MSPRADGGNLNQAPPHKRRHARRHQQFRDLPIIRDDEAERAVVGCVLYGRDHEELDPALIVHDGRRALLCAAITLRATGEDEWPPPASGDVGAQDRAAIARAERVARAVRQAETWPNPDSPDWELTQCLNAATQPDLIAYHVDLLIDAWRRRQAVSMGERLIVGAADPTADIAEIGASLNIEDLRNGAGPRQPISEPIWRWASEIEPERISWLWPNRLPLGMLTLLYGDGGVGKSLVTVSWAATVSRGAPWPDGQQGCAPGGVVFLAAEDGAAQGLIPRLDAAGADRSKIAIVEGERVRREGSVRERPISLSRDVELVRTMIEKVPHCRLIIIDPIGEYLPDTNTDKDNTVRAALSPLRKLAQEKRVAVVIVGHATKRSDATASQKCMGSVAFVNAVRATYVAGFDPKDPTPDPNDRRRILVPAKWNIPIVGAGLSYTSHIDPNWPDAMVLAWSVDGVDVSADELVAPADRDPEMKPVKVEEAKQFLLHHLSQGRVSVSDLQSKAKPEEIAPRTLRRALTELGGKTYREGFGRAGVQWWELPDTILAKDHRERQLGQHGGVWPA